MIRHPPGSQRTTHSFPTRRSSGLQAASRHIAATRNSMFSGVTPAAVSASTATEPITIAPELTTLLRSEEHTSELQQLMRNSYAVLCLKNKEEKDIATDRTQPRL